MASSLPYQEPSLDSILILAGFLLLLNGANKILDYLLYCGLVGQVFVGVVFGTPVAKLLDDSTETTISDLGYLGLILLVYEGGLSTSLSGLISSSVLSVFVALTGILLPIALSYLLLPLGASPLQCFSAGASLSATSLGTAFTTLSSSKLVNTRVGTILTSAAMLDDVIGLIMLQVVTELSVGKGTGRNYGKVIGRALGASTGLVVAVIAICRLVLRPLHKPIVSWAHSPKRRQQVRTIWEGHYLILVAHTALLLVLIVAGSYAGTSVLLAAFVAGVVVRWWDDKVAQPGDTGKCSVRPESSQAVSSRQTPLTGLQLYEQYYGPANQWILKPFFFASIGFSIPITQMFHASTVWKGLLYSLLMFLGKVATGLWLVPSSLGYRIRPRISFPINWFKDRIPRRESKLKPEADRIRTIGPEDEPVSAEKVGCSPTRTDTRAVPAILTTPENSVINTLNVPTDPTEAAPHPPNAAGTEVDSNSPRSSPNPQSQVPPMPEKPTVDVSDTRTDPVTVTSPPSNANPADLDGNPTATPSTISEPQNSALATSPPEQRALRAYAPALLGLAMTARGEIGFLIASIAETRGIFSSTSSAVSDEGVGEASELYLVAVWAIVVCTIVGPVTVGGLVRRIKRLEIQGQS